MFRFAVKDCISKVAWGTPASFCPIRSMRVRFVQTRNFSHTSTASGTDTKRSPKRIPDQAQVVICGGGVLGTAVAYHLALEGFKDVILLEQGSLTCGTTWHSAGLLGRIKSTGIEAEICKYSMELYQKMEAEGYNMGLKTCGSLNVARTSDRMIYSRRCQAKSSAQGIECHIVGPEEIKKLCPLMKVDDLKGGLWVPGDGAASASDVCMSFASAAKEKGLRVFENCKIERVLSENGRVAGVLTNEGPVKCQYFVNCTGQWAHELGKLSSPTVKVPLHPCERYYLVTKPSDSVPVDRMMPVIRDYDGFIYFREWSGGILVGGYEEAGTPVFHEGIPEKFEYQLLPEEWDKTGIELLMDNMLLRMPALETVEIRQLLNGPESFSVDGKMILGEAPEMGGYFVAAGMNSTGIMYAGGAGKLIAEWIKHGEPTKDAWSLDIRRFVDLHNNKKLLRGRTTETSSSLVTWIYPSRQAETCRKLRVSPLYSRLEQLGAEYGEINGYERPLYFHNEGYDSSAEGSSQRIEPRPTFYKPDSFENMKSEYLACKQGICLFDASSVSKVELKSIDSEVVNYLQHLSASDIDQPIGTVVKTPMLNHRGGYENDCSIVRLASNHFLMIAPAPLQTRCVDWLSKNQPRDGSVMINDVTSKYAALEVIGPKAEHILSQSTDTSLQKQGFPNMTGQVVNIGMTTGILAVRQTNSREDGFTLYIPPESAAHVFDTLMETGKAAEIRNVGYLTVDTLRIEHQEPEWGREINPFTIPLHVGKDSCVNFDKQSFIGRESLLKLRAEGLTKRLVHFTVQDHDDNKDPWLWGGEPIQRNGRHVGFVSSHCYSYPQQTLTFLAVISDTDENSNEKILLSDDWVMKEGQFEVNISGKLFPVKPSLHSTPFDISDNNATNRQLYNH